MKTSNPIVGYFENFEDPKKNFDRECDKFVTLGYGYRLRTPQYRKIRVYRDVVFDELPSSAVEVDMTASNNKFEDERVKGEEIISDDRDEKRKQITSSRVTSITIRQEMTARIA